MLVSMSIDDKKSPTLPLRGGVGFGFGAKYGKEEDSQLYSSALSRAVAFEKSAQWPRVLIDPEIVTYLDAHADESTKGHRALFTKKLAVRARSLVFEDSDQKPSLDFMGRAALEDVNDKLRAEITTAVLDFSQRGHRKHQLDDKLGPRYKALLDYVQSRNSIFTMPGGGEETR